MYSNTVTKLLAALPLLAPVDAFWRMSCPGRLLRERADPIVNPGAVAGHLHTISGGNGFGFNMNFDQARASQCSSCSIKQDFSNYWTPQLMYQAANGSVIPVPVVGDGKDEHGGMTVYYLQRGDKGEQLKAFPKDFRMLAGDPYKRSFGGDLASKAVNFACIGAGKDETNELPNYNCPGGLRAQIFFPSCWDGKNLDSADHKSHMSYPAGQAYNAGACPSTHPVHLISIFFEILYDTNKFAGEWHNGKQPFVFANGDSTGYGFHGDFVNGWDVDVLQKAVDECTADSGKVEDCKHFTQYTGAESQNCRLPNQINEQVDGWMPALPGCNPITAGPAAAVKVANCDATSTIGQAATFFTDVTVTKKWEYAGCGTDDYYNRALKGKNTNGDKMSVESCIDFCSSNGFSYAGLEFGRECYCDNSLPAANAPKQGVMGNCMTKCSGDDGEYCGGAAALSIYHKCDGACQNAQYGVVGNGTSTAPLSEDAPAPSKSGSGSTTGSGSNANSAGTGSNAQSASKPTSTAAATPSKAAAVVAAEQPAITVSSSNKGVDNSNKNSSAAPSTLSTVVKAAPTGSSKPTEPKPLDDKGEWVLECDD